MATDSIDRVKRPFLHQKARSHFQRRRKVVDSEVSKALLARSHMVAHSCQGDAPWSSSRPRASPRAPRSDGPCPLLGAEHAPAANPGHRKLQSCLGAFPIMESDVFNRLIGAWHPAGAGAKPPPVNPPPSGMGAVCRRDPVLEPPSRGGS